MNAYAEAKKTTDPAKAVKALMKSYNDKSKAAKLA